MVQSVKQIDESKMTDPLMSHPQLLRLAISTSGQLGNLPKLLIRDMGGDSHRNIVTTVIGVGSWLLSELHDVSTCRWCPHEQKTVIRI